jgi:hypothetical protein
MKINYTLCFIDIKLLTLLGPVVSYFASDGMNR